MTKSENPEPPAKLSSEDKLDKIVHYLERMDRRDRWRTYGGFVRGLLGILPLLILLGSLWYTYTHLNELLGKVAGEAAKQAAHYTQESSGDFMKQVQKMMKR